MTRTRATPPRFRLRRAPRILVCASAVVLLSACGGGQESRMAEARELQAAGRLDASIEVLREALQAEPDLPEAQYRLGLALVQTGKLLRAVEPLRRAADSAEYEISAGVLLASTLFRTQNYDEAVRAADRVLAADPSRLAAMRIRATANLAAGRAGAALEDAAQLVENAPDDYGVRTLHARALAELGRIEEAEREHQLLKELGQKSSDPGFRERACLQPAMFARGVLHDMEQAKALYDDCASRTPTDTFVINHLVSFYDTLGDRERGTALWREAVASRPDDLALRQGFAGRLEGLDQFERAEQVLREGVERAGSATAWSLLADFYRTRRQPRQALEAIERAMELSNGGDAPLRFTQGDVLVDLGELERAGEVAKQLEPNAYAQVLRGRIQLARGRPAEALEILEAALDAWPDSALVRYLAGVAAREMGNTERAVSEFRSAVRANLAETEAALELARILYERRRYPQALTFANMARAAKISRDPSEPYVIAARSLAALGQPARAREAIGSLRDAGYEAVAAREEIALERRTSGAEAALEIAAQQSLDLADPANLEVLREVVGAELDAGRPDAAEARVEKALARHPDAPRLLEIRGEVLARTGRDAQAAAAFQKALEQDSESPRACAGLAALSEKEGDAERAIELFDRAYALAPGEPAYAYAAARLAQSSGGPQAAAGRLRRIVRHHPGATAARRDLARLLAEQGEDLDLALALARDARELDPTPESLETLGWVHVQRGEIERAVPILESALTEQPDSPSLSYRLGVALQKSGDDERARKLLERALAAGPFPEAQDARRRLDE